MCILKSIKLSVLLLFTVSTSIIGQDKGLEIARNSEKADIGYKSCEVDLKMILTNKQGQTSVNLLKNKTLEIPKDGDKSIIEFNSPKDVKGTKTLTFTHKTGDDDQWIYLPAVARVKRISSSNKSGPFMGSEFAFEDLSSFEVEKYTYKYISESTVGSDKIAIVEMDPKDTKSGYTRIVGKFNLSKNYRVEELEFYDKKNAKLKTLTYSDYKLYNNKYYRASTLNMVNHQSGKKTELQFSNYKFGVNLSENDLTEANLKN
ncbi:MAG TPA: outer membrane lipoprotein-sorting protein [Saprospiraceae bacterium]|nr:outer membrane lipoprotein-sorting protein [Saprospiraceae bacterium]